MMTSWGISFPTLKWICYDDRKFKVDSLNITELEQRLAVTNKNSLRFPNRSLNQEARPMHDDYKANY